MPDGNESGFAEAVETPAPPPNAVAANVSPTSVRKNPKNPRLKFRQSTIEALAESIETVGVLVPITVYHEPAEDGTTYVLLDGERRLRAALLIDLPQIPAWVVPKPSPQENTLRMFNIHMLREEWTEIATAWALEELMKEMGTTDVMELHRVTGLSPSRIQNAQSVLRYPREWQERVFEEEIPYQLLVELDKAVLGKARRKPELVLGYSEEFLRDAFLKKYVEGFLGDVVDMRKVSALIRTASEGGFAGEQAKVALRDLVENPATRIEDAYEAGAAASVELGKVLRDINNLPQRLGQLFATDLDDDHKAKLLDALSRLRAQLEDFLEEFGSA